MAARKMFSKGFFRYLSISVAVFSIGFVVGGLIFLGLGSPAQGLMMILFGAVSSLLGFVKIAQYRDMARRVDRDNE